ncbi:MAG: adenylate/guanylate cyclase domain-containing protein [Gallionella sp.]|nr:adenylate/guanylate cyclase domain-containing protein [Gallionella sp.]
MEERGNKTIMCSVLFLDIVEYSKMSVSGQISLKDRFNSYLSAAIRDMPVADRIILDTGDGAAINFLGDVEDALKAALSLRESILNEDSSLKPPLLVRAGINLGPVRLVRDINGQPNIVGDGINVAQRIMSFADVDQILVSRSYHDAVSRLSSEYAGMFSYQGSRTDKHVREHEVYAIGHLGDKTAELIATSVLAAQKSGVSARFLAAVRESWNAVISWSDNVIKNFRSRFEQADRRQRAIYAGAIAVPVVLIGVLVLTLGGRDEMPAQPDAESLSAASGIEPVPTAAPAIPVAPVTESKTAETSPAQPAAAPKPDAKKMTGSKPSSKKPADSMANSKKTSGQSTSDQPTSDQPTSDQPKQADTQHKSPSTESADKKGWLDTIIGGDAARQGAQAHIAVKCNPGTQVFIDGAQKGKIISGVLVVDVPAGKHTVIVTGTGGEVYSQKVELAEGKTANIRPGFCY